MTSNGNQRGDSGKSAALRASQLWASFALTGAFLVLLIGLSYALKHGHLQALTESLVAQGVGAVVVAGLAALIWEFRRWLMRTLTSLPFSAALLTFLLVLTVLGTVILQQAPPEAYLERHGKVLGMVLLALGIDDIFHTVWFNGLLGLIPVSLVLTVIERRAWRLSMWGHLLSHMGFVVVMVGGWIGGQYGFKGVIDFHEGEVVTEAHLQGKGGVRGPAQPLGFSLKLEKFAVENYVAEAKFYVYERSGMSYRAVRVFDTKEAATTRNIGSSGASFHLVKAYPNFYLKPEVHEVPAGKGAPVLQIDFKQGDWVSRAALQAGIADQDSVPLSGMGPRLRFVWATPSEGDIARLAEGSADTHQIAVQGAGEPESVTVEVDKATVLPNHGFDIKVLEYLPDFTYDSQAKKASTRSQEPNNPAVRVMIRNQKTKEEKIRWLFASKPDFGHGKSEAEGPQFLYRFTRGHQPPMHEFLALGEARQLWQLEKGRVVQRLPLEQWQSVCTDLPVVGMTVTPSAVIEAVPTTRSAAYENPVADIILEEGGKTREVRVATQHGQPIALADGKTFLSFELRSDEPKSFRSHLTVLENGVKITEKTIVVNDPLSYKGYMFYQANFRKEDPTYSGIQVVRDPGLGIVFLGFLMMSIGVVFVYYIRPRILAGESHGN